MRGASLVQEGVRFSVWAPRASRVEVVCGDARAPMPATSDGVFEVTLPASAGDDYAFVLDGGPERPDPRSRHQPHGVHGRSRVVDPAFAWSPYRRRALAEYVICEVHVGTFTPEGTFDGAIARLDHLAETGFTAVEIMPVADFPGARNWGYDGVDLFAPAAAYGGPDAMRRFVDACHVRGLAVILDVVYNHFGPEGAYWDEFGPYTSDAYRTPWGRPLNVDGAGSDEVRAYLLDNARMWSTEFRVDALRLDAANAIVDLSVRHILSEMAAAVPELILIGETNRNDPRVVRPEREGGVGLHAQWSDDFHHAVHAAVLGRTGAHRIDFGQMAQIGKALTDGFVFDGAYSRYRGRRHGAPAGELGGERFVVNLQNHDRIANDAQSVRLPGLAPRSRVEVATVLLLTSPNVPLLFMGQEYGETRPFHFFTSHGDPALVEAVRRGRAKEQAVHGGMTSDPQDPATFEASTLGWVVDEATLALHRELLRLRRTVPALGAGSREGVTATSSEEPPWLVVHRRAGASEAWIVVHFGGDVPVRPAGTRVLALADVDVWVR